MSVKRVTPDEAAELVQQGWSFVDVRSVPEFADGHPTGAYNVPLLHRGPTGMTPNSRFVEVMERRFPKDSRLVVGCRSGGRSLRAATMLIDRGYAEVVDMRGGYVGEQKGGQVTCEGWQRRGLPTSMEPEPGRTWSELEGES
jgi:rhodanese-related sulfurtransferase